MLNTQDHRDTDGICCISLWPSLGLFWANRSTADEQLSKEPGQELVHFSLAYSLAMDFNDFSSGDSTCYLYLLM